MSSSHGPYRIVLRIEPGRGQCGPDCFDKTNFSQGPSVPELKKESGPIAPECKVSHCGCDGVQFIQGPPNHHVNAFTKRISFERLETEVQHRGVSDAIDGDVLHGDMRGWVKGSV